MLGVLPVCLRLSTPRHFPQLAAPAVAFVRRSAPAAEPRMHSRAPPRARSSSRS
eukprot:COSAG02_NODE_21686_length_778_cov_1.578792_1_plen_53_part_10